MNKQKVFCGQDKPLDLPEGRAAKQCENCKSWFHLPKCHASRHKCCSAKCGDELRDKRKKERQRNCKVCGSPFIPRPRQVRLGQGVYCSSDCLTSVLHTFKTPEMEEKRIAAMREKMARGEWNFPKGPDNPLWTGGPEAARKRQTESGKSKARTKRYRKENPHRVREWTSKRTKGYTGRLPRGTIPRLLVLQKNKCASCLQSLSGGYHVDHIQPIAKGGKHEPHNLQILCPSCNLRKSDSLPHEFAQKNGKLL